MASKNRTIQSFIALVPDYVRSKSDKCEASLQRCLQVMCCMEKLDCLIDLNEPNVVEFYISLRELLRACESIQPSSGLGWKAVELIKHLESRPEILDFLRLDEFGLVPVLAQYLIAGGVQPAADKSALALSVLEPLTQGIQVQRTGLWLSGFLKYLTQAVLERIDNLLPNLLAVLSNLCLENEMVVIELHRQSRSDELLSYLIQLQASDPLVQLHAAQVVFSLLAAGSINESLLANYMTTVTELLIRGAQTGHVALVSKCGSVLAWMSRDRLVVEMIHAARLQDLLRKTVDDLVPILVSSSCWAATDSVLHLLARLVRSGFLAGKKLAECWIPQLVMPLLSHPELTDSLLELLAELLKATGSTVSLADESWDHLATRLIDLIDRFNDVNSPTACRTLRYSLQILQKLYKMAPSVGAGRSGSALKPETFVTVVGHFVVLVEPEESNDGTSSSSTDGLRQLVGCAESVAVVVEALTLLGQIVSLGGRGGDWFQHYSYLLGQTGVQHCLATAILHGDAGVKQATLALVGTLGFSTDSVTGLSQALNQLCDLSRGPRHGSVGPADVSVPGTPGAQLPSRSESSSSLLHWTTASPSQAQRIDKLMQKVQQANQEIKKCEVMEVMELQLERRKREEHRLRAELDAAGRQISDLNFNHRQIQAENDRMMAMLLAKADLVENKEAENRALSRRLEQTQQQLKKAEGTWKKERDRMREEKSKQERAQAEAAAQLQAQLEAAKKQIASLIAKNEETDAELQEALKAAEGYKASAEKRERRLEKQGNELKECQAQVDTLRKSLAKKEKDCEEKERENSSLKQQLKKSEVVREDVEARLAESEKTCRETKEQLVKLEKIQEFIFELSSGKKKIFDETSK